MGHTAELGCGPSPDWAHWEPGEDPDAQGELEELHGIPVHSDDRVVIIGGFLVSSIAVE